jgi:sulfur carrier protein
MKILLNGDYKTVAESSSVLDLLRTLELTDKRVAVEINGEIVPRSQHEIRQICEHDQVEVVVAVGGG